MFLSAKPRELRSALRRSPKRSKSVFPPWCNACCRADLCHAVRPSGPTLKLLSPRNVGTNVCRGSGDDDGGGCEFDIVVNCNDDIVHEMSYVDESHPEQIDAMVILLTLIAG